MKTLVTSVAVCAIFASSSLVSAAESIENLANQLMTSSNIAQKVAKRLSPEYSQRTDLMVLAAEISTIATSIRYGGDEPSLADVEALREKLAVMRTVNKDLAEAAEADDDEDAMVRVSDITRLIRKMKTLSIRLADVLEG